MQNLLMELSPAMNFAITMNWETLQLISFLFNLKVELNILCKRVFDRSIDG